MFSLHAYSFLRMFGLRPATEQRIHFPPRSKWGDLGPCADDPLLPFDVTRTETRPDAYIEKFIGDDHRHRLAELSGVYDLFVTSGRGYAWNFSIFSDCTYTIILTCKENDVYRPIACIGFDVSRLWSTITVGQIQGVGTPRANGKHDKSIARYLLPLRWEQMLLTLLRDYAKQEGFRRIRVIPARKQTYFCEEREARFIRRYETTAKLLGFSRSWFGYHVYRLHW